MSGPSPTRLWQYAGKCLRLDRFFLHPGDGRKRPQIPAKDLLWGQVIGQILQLASFHSLERLVRTKALRALGVSRRFSEDTLGYFDDRLDPQPMRSALAQTLRLAKRNKAFRGQPWIGLALDGTAAGHTNSLETRCTLCRPVKDAEDKIIGHRHELSMISVVGTNIALPFDVEPYGPGDSEYASSRRLLTRAVEHLGVRFAQYVVADAKFGAAPILNDIVELGLDAIVRLKANLPDLHGRATVRFNGRPPDSVVEHHGERIEFWDDEDFAPWEGLRWSSVRVLRYRQHRRDGEVIEAYWLTSFPQRQVGSLTLFKLAKSRWEIENQGFNEAKTRHGMEHIRRHQPNCLLVCWLIMLMALVIERLYRLCHLHRGTHPLHTAADLKVLLWLALGQPRGCDTS